MASREPLIEPYRPHGPDEGYDYDYDEYLEREGAPEGRVLWGRVAALGGALLLAFLIGRASAPGGVPADDLRRARADARAAEQETEALREEIDTLQAEIAELDQEKGGQGEQQGGEDAETVVEKSTTYTVEANDTLTTIAEKVYGDPSLDDLIAEANPEVDPLALRVGQVLVIPPKPEE